MARSSIDPLVLMVNLCIQSTKVHGDNPAAISKDVMAKINGLPEAERKRVQETVENLLPQKD